MVGKLSAAASSAERKVASAVKKVDGAIAEAKATVENKLVKADEEKGQTEKEEKAARKAAKKEKKAAKAAEEAAKEAAKEKKEARQEKKAALEKAAAEVVKAAAEKKAAEEKQKKEAEKEAAAAKTKKVHEFLPAAAAMDQNSSKVFQSVSAKLDILKARLKTAKHASEEKLIAHKAELEEQLAKARENNTAMEHQNHKLRKKIAELTTRTADLHKKALALQKEGGDLEMTLVAARRNISISQQFVNAMEADAPSDDFKLKILQELADREQAHIQAHAQHKAMKEIRHMAMLQVEDTLPDLDAIQHVQALRDSFAQLEAEEQASMQELDNTFMAEMGAEGTKQHDLSIESKELWAQKKKLVLLQERLIVACDHLEKAKNRIEKDIASLKAYTTRISTED